MRQQMSLPEVLLWNLLRGAPDGVVFRRQHPVGGYVVDFYCAAAKVGIEIDGISHDMAGAPERDQRRDAELRGLGLEVVRVPAADVLKSPEAIAQALVRYCKRS
ncbi:endonuclease domain-containing protein [Novosphingobium bradum]|uniref:Endonuclease domain-containing protein n=1 Tax=Novosphingobium bradum TaxID=1737444 RepID=A0ABV7IPM1_9SPHN